MIMSDMPHFSLMQVFKTVSRSAMISGSVLILPPVLSVSCEPAISAINVTVRLWTFGVFLRVTIVKSIMAHYRYKRDHNKPKYSDTYRTYQFDHFPSPPFCSDSAVTSSGSHISPAQQSQHRLSWADIFEYLHDSHSLMSAHLPS